MINAKSMPISIKDAQEHAEEAGLRYVYDSDKGLTRRKSGKGFTYLKDGKVLKDKKQVERIKKLAIPPAWQDVWICSFANGHLQATGLDDRGRKQYKYHENWRVRRDENKFSTMLAFGQNLPLIRRRVLAALNREGLPKEKVIAAVVRLLDRTGLRVGNDAYADENQTYGLTTMRKKHLEINGKIIELDFPAKGGKIYKGNLTDAKLSKVLSECGDLPGYRLFKYVSDDGEAHNIGSAEVNTWLQEITGETMTAKDFRTWTACALFLEEALKHCQIDEKLELKPIFKIVSDQLGNTPAILKKSYVHPELVDLYRTGCLMEKEWELSRVKNPVEGLSKVENLLLIWLKKTYG